MPYPVSPVRPLTVLQGKTNGRLPANILVTFPGQAGGSSITLVSPAARAFKALFAAAKKAGHILKTDTPQHSYRTYTQQVATFKARYVPYYTRHTDGSVRYRIWQGQRWYHKQGPVVAVPGTSNHGWGRAVDTGEERDGDNLSENFDTATLNWLIANEQRFGISHEIQSEPWHLRYFAGDTPPAAVLAYEKSLKPTTPPDEEDEEMATWYIWFKDNRDPATGYTRYNNVSVKPLVSGVHCYAMTGGVGVYQGPESLAIAEYLAGLAKKPLTKVGSKTKPVNIIDAGKASGWFIGACLLDGPLAGIKK